MFISLFENDKKPARLNKKTKRDNQKKKKQQKNIENQNKRLEDSKKIEEISEGKCIASDNDAKYLALIAKTY